MHAKQFSEYRWVWVETRGDETDWYKQAAGKRKIQTSIKIRVCGHTRVSMLTGAIEKSTYTGTMRASACSRHSTAGGTGNTANAAGRTEPQDVGATSLPAATTGS